MMTVKYCNVRSNRDIIHEINVFVLLVYIYILIRKIPLFVLLDIASAEFAAIVTINDS